MAQAGSVVQFSGHNHLRHRLALSILSGKAVRIDKIRSQDKNPGLQGAYELEIEVGGIPDSYFLKIMKSACCGY